MEALDFCKRVCEAVRLPYYCSQLSQHYSRSDDKISICFDIEDDIWWASIYVMPTDRLLYVGWSEKDNYWLQENPVDGNVFDHKCSQMLAPCLKVLKKILIKDGVR